VPNLLHQLQRHPYIKALFGKEFALEKRLPIALQFVTFDGAQRASLISANLPAHIATAIDSFHNGLSDDEQKDPKFRFRVAFVPKVSGKATFLPSEIVVKARAAGYPDRHSLEGLAASIRNDGLLQAPGSAPPPRCRMGRRRREVKLRPPLCLSPGVSIRHAALGRARAFGKLNIGWAALGGQASNFCRRCTTTFTWPIIFG
jgi:hypothetical protein